jgi:uncharacterized protein involved in exopolysaccharide biosynthesis
VEYQTKNSGGGQGTGEEEDSEPFDWEKVAGYGRFLGGALVRRKFLALFVLVSAASAAYGLYWALPRRYHIETQLLAQKEGRIGTMTGSGGSERERSPTAAAAETVMRRDNLVALLQKSDVVANWDALRSNAGRLKDRLNSLLGRGAPSDEDKFEMALGTLADSLSVETHADWGGEGTVSIALDWADPKMGYRLVNAAQQSFIEARHVADLAPITEATAILQARASTLRDQIEETVKKIEGKRAEHLERKKAGEPGERRPRSATAAAAPAAEPISAADREATQQLQALWESKKATIKDLEENRRRRINELQTKLAELRATYAESHPAIVDTIQTIESLSQESPQVAHLKREESELRSQYVSRTSKNLDSTSPGEALARPALRGNSLRATAEPAAGDDRETEFAKAQLKIVASAYDKVLERIEATQLDLESVRASLKYHYAVVHPPQVPRAPSKPQPMKILGGGMAAAFALALLAAVAADLRSGRVYEGWQLERALRLPVLAEIRREH